MTRRSTEEVLNTTTHLAGFCFALFSSWYLIWLGSLVSWQYSLSVSLFFAGMAMMYGSSSIYHWAVKENVKKALRKLDHISIYVMIAASYSPICIGLLGGTLGWTMFVIQWALVIGGVFYKLFALGKWPALSLFLYLAMGWSVIFIAKPVYFAMSTAPLICLIVEGLSYTLGTYFYSKERKYYHAIWHLFVLVGSIAHWLLVLFLLFEQL
ncbi:MAG: hemolysin III family protein [Bacteroidaceae bacterium]|nr:hemolysin III family protein [Bacteroidaceae bacterium]